MTVRDNIYKNYQKWWEAYATLKRWLIPWFIEFIEKSHFKKKSALDIWCWNGKYLVYLKNIGFEVSGTDSSETAVEMTKTAIGNEWDIMYKDMYEMDIKPDNFDLIMSIQAIHHWKKEEVKILVKKIHSWLSNEGKIFLTLPDYQSSTYRNTFKDKEEIAPWTYSPLSWSEKWLPHSFFTKEEIKNMFNEFKNLKYELDGRGKRIITWEK